MSYRELNQVICTLTFPIHCCVDTVQGMDKEEKYFIDADMYSGYWQVVSEDEARERLAFFAPGRKLRWKVMHVGALNAATTFVAIMMKLHMEWDTLAKERGLENVASKIIVDYLLFYGITT